MLPHQLGKKQLKNISILKFSVMIKVKSTKPDRVQWVITQGLSKSATAWLLIIFLFYTYIKSSKICFISV